MRTHSTHDRPLATGPIGGLTGIASALEEQRRSPAFNVLSFEERLGLLVDRDAAERGGKKLASYQPPYALTSLAQSLVAMDRMVSGSPTSAFQASQQASRMAS